MKIIGLALSLILGWTTFAGSPERNANTQVKAWPPFSYKWSTNLGPPGTRVFCPVSYEGYRICKYILRNDGHSINVRAFDRNGGELWHFSQDLDNKHVFAIGSKDWQGSPSVSKQCVYFTGTRKLYCLAIDSGRLLWEHEYPIRQSSDISASCPLVYGESGFDKVAVAFEDKVYFHEATRGTVLKVVANIAPSIPPAKLLGESIVSPVHTDFSGQMLPQLPKEALKVSGGFGTENGIVAGYFLNARWKAWRFDRSYNRWEKAWDVEDPGAVESPFWSYRLASLAKDRIILSFPNKITCVDYGGGLIWSLPTELARWNQYVPVAGNVALVACYIKSKTLQAVDIRDGFPYEPQELPVFIQAPPVPTDDGFMVMSSGGGIWAFSGSDPPKAEIVMPKTLAIPREWVGYSLHVGVKNMGGSRMTFGLKADGKAIASLARCNPGETVSFSLTLESLEKDFKVTVEADGDGGRDSKICHVSIAGNPPDRKDVNLDGRVDFADALTIMANLGKVAEGRPWEILKRCDINGDLKVTFLDLAEWGEQ